MLGSDRGDVAHEERRSSTGLARTRSGQRKVHAAYPNPGSGAEQAETSERRGVRRGRAKEGAKEESELENSSQPPERNLATEVTPSLEPLSFPNDSPRKVTSKYNHQSTPNNP